MADQPQGQGQHQTENYNGGVGNSSSLITSASTVTSTPEFKPSDQLMSHLSSYSSIHHPHQSPVMTGGVGRKMPEGTAAMASYYASLYARGNKAFAPEAFNFPCNSEPKQKSRTQAGKPSLGLSSNTSNSVVLGRHSHNNDDD